MCGEGKVPLATANVYIVFFGAGSKHSLVAGHVKCPPMLTVRLGAGTPSIPKCSTSAVTCALVLMIITLFQPVPSHKNKYRTQYVLQVLLCSLNYNWQAQSGGEMIV